jgi:hypothetical protein
MLKMQVRLKVPFLVNTDVIEKLGDLTKYFPPKKPSSSGLGSTYPCHLWYVILKCQE